MSDLHRQIAYFISAYRLAGGAPSAMQAAVLAAFDGAGASDYARGLLLANRLERESAGEGEH